MYTVNFKFNFGDTCWLIRENKIQEATVIKIDYTKGEYSLAPQDIARTTYTVSLKNEVKALPCLTEEMLFETKEQLIGSL